MNSQNKSDSLFQIKDETEKVAYRGVRYVSANKMIFPVRHLLLAFLFSIVFLSSFKRVEAGFLKRCVHRMCNKFTGDRVSDVSLPTSPEELRRFMHEFTRIERNEMRRICKIFYIPCGVNKLVRNISGSIDVKISQGLPGFQSGDQIGFRYKIIRYVANGSHGTVIKAQDMSSKSEEPEYVAIKVNDKTLKKLTASEGNMLRQLVNTERNVHIIQLKDTVYYRGWQAWILPYYAWTWEAFSKRLKPISLKRIRKLAHDMTVALDYLQSKNIIHCDIKPGNILYDASNESSYLSDFGLAIHADEAKPKDYRGTPPFMAPEFLMNLMPSYASDMWSLGATLFAITTGKHLTKAHGRTIEEKQRSALIVLMMRIEPELPYVSGKLIPVFAEYIAAVEEGRNLYYVSLDEEMDEIRTSYQEKDQLTFDLLLDFIKRCLVWEPTSRITAQEALEHPFISNIR